MTVIQQIGKLGNNEDEHQQHRGDTGNDENGRIGQRVAEFVGNALIIFHLVHGLAQALGERAAHLTGLHQIIDILG